MTFSLLYWLLMVIWLVLGVWQSWPIKAKESSGTLLLYALMVLVGWKVFGPPIHD